MDPSKKPSSITEVVSFLKEKQKAQQKDSCYVQELLMSCEKNFKNELEDMKKKFDDEKKRIEESYMNKIVEKIEEERKRMGERYMKIIAEKTEYYKEQTNVLLGRLDELKNEKSEKEANLHEEYQKKIQSLNEKIENLTNEKNEKSEKEANLHEEYQKKIQSLNEKIENLTNEKNEAEHKIDVYSEKFSDFHRRIYHIEQNMNKSVEKCSCGKSRNEDPLPISVASERGDPANPLASKAIVCSEKRSFVGDTSVNPERSSKIARIVPYSEQNSVFMRLKDKVGVQDRSELPLRLSDKPHDDSDSSGKLLSEDDLCSAFEKDPEVCWKAICALYRQQISENKSSYSMSQIDDMSIAELGKYLTNGDPDNKLRRTTSEVSLNDHKRCKRLAIRYGHQLVHIYNSKKDRLFCAGAGIL